MIAYMTASSNTMTFDKLMAIADQLGTDAGKGKDTQAKFLLANCEGGYGGVVDLEKDKHGKEIDDATKLAERYVKSQGTATVFDAKAPNQRKLVSCIRKMIQLGMWPKGGTGEPLATVNNLLNMRQKLRADPLNAKLLDDAANTMLKYARAQIKRDQLIDDAELKTFCFKPAPAHATPAEILEGIRKDLKALIDGKASAGTAHDNSPLLVKALDNVVARQREIAAKAPKAKGAKVSHAATAQPTA